jgi:hypothetical protein
MTKNSYRYDHEYGRERLSSKDSRPVRGCLVAVWTHINAFEIRDSLRAIGSEV